MDFPEPVIAVAIEPKTKADQDKLGAGLQRLAEEDPTFRVRTDEETGQTLISGMGELHLEIIVDRLMREFSSTRTSAGRRSPTARRSASPVEKIEGKFVRQTGGRGQYGHAVINVEPDRAGRGLRVRRQDRRRQDPARVHRRRSTSASRRRWSPASSPATRSSTCGSSSIDGSFHDVDSSEMAFKVAGSMAFKEAMKRSKPKLLEPVMAVEVVTPEDYLGDVMGDLNSRRGRVEGLEPRGNAQAIQAHVPLATMFGYATDLRSTTQGRATFTMQFDRYEEVPQSIAGELVDSQSELNGRKGTNGQAEVRAHASRISTSARSVTSTTARRR